MKNYTISRNGIDDYIWDVEHICINSAGFAPGERAVAPLAYYINTGRASVEFLRKLFRVHPRWIARILLDGRSDHETLSRVKKRIGYDAEV